MTELLTRAISALADFTIGAGLMFAAIVALRCLYEIVVAAFGAPDDEEHDAGNSACGRAEQSGIRACIDVGPDRKAASPEEGRP